MMKTLPPHRSIALILLAGLAGWLAFPRPRSSGPNAGPEPGGPGSAAMPKGQTGGSSHPSTLPAEASEPERAAIERTVAHRARWTAVTATARSARVEIIHDPNRKYPWVRREIFRFDTAAATAPPASGAPTTAAPVEAVIEMVADHVILQAPGHRDEASLHAALPAGYRVLKPLLIPGAWLIGIDGADPTALPRALTDLAALGTVEPDGYLQDAALPNDPRLGEQWAMGATDGGIAPTRAWDRETGDPSVLVAVIDTGVDYAHPDLAANITANPGETGGGKETNGIDDDGNGFIDDWRGWDFSAPGLGDNDPMDDRRDQSGQLVGHGTHVAGIIGAVGNNGIGISGVAWRVGILPVKALNSEGRGTWSDVTDALAYAVRRGAKISNNAYGTWVAPSSIVKSAVELARDAGMLFVASAGNGEYPANGATTGDDMDRYPYFPASLDVANIVAVAAHGPDGALAAFSNFGRSNADLTAPGLDILSTLAGGGYGQFSGTSMSSAFVSGAAAVAASLDPRLDRLGLLATLNAHVTRDDRYRSQLRWAGRLNLEMSTRAAARPLADRRIAAGAAHFLHVRPDGTVAGWGRAGAIGLGATAVDATIEPTPTTLPPFSEAIGVAAAGLASYVLTATGEIWVAGLVKATPAAPGVSHPTFTRVHVIAGAVAIAGHGSLDPAHHENVAVLDEAGAVWMTGSNAFRQLGAGAGAAVPHSPDFFKVPELPPVVTLDVFDGTVCVVDEAGVAWRWGRGAGLSAVPVAVPGARPPLALAVTRYPELTRLAGVGRDGSVGFIDPASGATDFLATEIPARYAFGMGPGLGVDARGFGLVGMDGQLHTGGSERVDEVVGAAFNGSTGVALRSDGTSFTWGSKVGGLRGIGTYQFRSRPSPLLALPRTETSWSGGQGLALLGVDGWMRGIPYNDSFTAPSSIPAYPLNLASIVPAGEELRDRALGVFHALLVFSNGAVVGAGENFTGSLGLLPPVVTPWQNIGFAGSAMAAAAGYGHSLILDNQGGVWAAGDNAAGQLGDGNHPGDGQFRRIPSLNNITAIATDDFIRSFALDAAGTLWMWGNDEFFAPVPLPIGQSVIDFAVVPATAAGPVTHQLAVATTGGQVRLYPNFAGLPSALPAPTILDIPEATQVTLGVRHGLALTASGQVFAWGDNAAGQLGIGSFVNPPAGTAVRSTALGGITSIQANGRSSFAVGADGRFWRWGEDADLANLLGPDTPSQTLAVGLSNVIFDSGNPGDDWWTRYFSLDELQDDMLAGDESDPDDDGIPNLLEYALNSNPRRPDIAAEFFAIDEEVVSSGGSSNDGPAATSLESGQRYARLRLTRGTKRSDLEYEFQFSDDLETWYGGLDYFVTTLDVEEFLVALDTTPIPFRTHRFYRLIVYRR